MPNSPLITEALPREAFSTDKAYKQYKQFVKMIEREGNMQTPCKKCNELDNPCSDEHDGKLANTLITEALARFREKFLNLKDQISTIEGYQEELENFFTQELQTAIDKSVEDTKRLDFLDKCNLSLNKKYGTDYGWELIINQNITRLMIDRGLADIDLNDVKGGNDKLKSCRDAIDKKMESLSTTEREDK